MDPLQCTTDLGSPPLTSLAGITLEFSINLIDIYGNAELSSQDGIVASILAEYVDHASWPSPIGVSDLTNWDQIFGQDIAGISVDAEDGTLAAQVTVFRAGNFILHVLINGLDVVGSPFTPLEITPSEIYGPSCIVDGLVSTSTAGAAITFNIQARDYYSNNIQDLFGAAVTDYIVDLVDDSGISVATVTIGDLAANAGVYEVTLTPTLAGTFTLLIQFNGLNVDQSPYTLTIDSDSTTSAATSTITSFPLSYSASEYLQFTIIAKDAYGNIRIASIAEVFTVTLTETTTLVSAALSTSSNGDGTYSVSYQLQTTGTYTLSVQFSATDLLGTPVSGIEVSVGTV